MNKTKFDFAKTTNQLIDSAEGSANSRWSRAEQIVAVQPSGLSPVSTNAVNKTVNVRPDELYTTPASDIALNVLKVEISRVRDNPRNARKLYDPEVVNERAASLRQDGQMTPAPACLDWENPGGFILIGGHYRKKGLLQNGDTHIEIKLLSCKNLVELYRLSYAENEQRESGTPLDDALAWRELLDSGDIHHQDEIAAMVDKPRTTVNKTLALLTLPVPVLDVLKQSPEKFTLTAGYELSVMAVIFTEAELLDLASGVIAGEISTRDLTALKDQKKNAKPRKSKQLSRQHKIVLPGTSNGLLKEWDSGRVVLEITFSDSSERERLVNELRARFNVATTPVNTTTVAGQDS